MKTSTLTFAAIVGTFIAVASTATPANANCIKSTWKKTNGNSLADTIKGRDCGGQMSAKFIGPAGNTGWLNMSYDEEGILNSTFDDGAISTRAFMQTMGSVFMKVRFYHEDLSGAKSTTTGTYVLKSYK